MKSLLVLSLVLLSGCASVQHVQTRADGGRIRLMAAYPEYVPKARALAVVDMEKKCSGAYDITEEGLMQVPNTTGIAHGTHYEVPYIDYKCKNSAAKL